MSHTSFLHTACGFQGHEHVNGTFQSVTVCNCDSRLFCAFHQHCDIIHDMIACYSALTYCTSAYGLFAAWRVRSIARAPAKWSLRPYICQIWNKEHVQLTVVHQLVRWTGNVNSSLIMTHRTWCRLISSTTYRLISAAAVWVVTLSQSFSPTCKKTLAAAQTSRLHSVCFYADHQSQELWLCSRPIQGWRIVDCAPWTGRLDACMNNRVLQLTSCSWTTCIHRTYKHCTHERPSGSVTSGGSNQSGGATDNNTLSFWPELGAPCRLPSVVQWTLDPLVDDGPGPSDSSRPRCSWVGSFDL